MNQQRHFPLFEQRRHLPGFYPRIRRDADVQRLALLHRRGKGAGGLLQRGVRIETVGVKDIDIVHTQALQALIEAGQHVLARAAALPVRTRPHVPTGFTGDDQFIAILLEVFTQQAAEVDLGTAIGRAVVVGQVEMVDPQIERGTQQRALGVDRCAVAEVVPQTQGQCGQYQATTAHAAVRDDVVTVVSCDVSH